MASTRSERRDSLRDVTEEDLVKKRKAVEELEAKCDEKRKCFKQREEELKKQEEKTAQMKYIYFLDIFMLHNMAHKIIEINLYILGKKLNVCKKSRRDKVK